MEKFKTRYNKLNSAQKQAVDTIDGPLLVVAGPGTGKTELLSMRAANILRATDTLPENILCLTFTDSGANAMRARLASIIGTDAYKVAIQTFHSFGTEIINHHSEYFYRGADFSPADEVATYSILTDIFEELDYNNPLASKMNGDFTHLRDTAQVISELKQAGLSSSELLQIIDNNEKLLDTIEPELAAIFANRISKTTIALLPPIANKIAELPAPQLPPAIAPLADALALSMARAFDEAVASGKTTPITAWRNTWLEKDARGEFVFKDRKRHAKLRAVAPIYDQYLAEMRQAELFDYDDMILNVVQAIEQYPDLRFNLQERYQYIMVDEFQDTNLAQLRILFNLTDTPHGDAPNIMAVGDDDQAIYSFQGADVGNIHRFRKRYPDHASVVLTDNYRSSQTILDRAREIITQASGRLETSMDIDKHLLAHANNTSSQVTLSSLPSRQEEFAWIAESIQENITKGIKPSEIAVIARRHSDLIALLPYLNHGGIAVNYERRDNVLDDERVQLLELMARICVDIAAGEHDEANSLLPELVAQPMFDFDSEAIWRLSLQAYRNRTNWLEAMLASPTFQPLAKWLLDRAKASLTEPLETFLDTLIGVPQNYTANDDTDDDNDDSDAACKPTKSHRNAFISPFYQYYFNSDILDSSPDTYLTALEALQTLRGKLREGAPDSTLLASDFLTLIDTYRQLNIPVVSIRRASEAAQHAVNLMSAHKSKGLEFDTVYVINSIDSMWGERVRSRSRLISYPENLAISPNADSYDERIRLYFVAMTRAKRQLYLSYARSDDTAKDTLKASFLAGTNLQEIDRQPSSTAALAEQSEIVWHDRLTAPINRTMKELLAPTLENYKLSVTHLNNFIDVTRGGPQNFLLNNLLRFPQAKSANAIYGTLIHAVLQHAHSHLAASGTRKPIEDITGEFIRLLHQQNLSDADLALYSKRGIEALEAFLGAKYDTFKPSQKPELSFAGQGVILGQARLTGSLDLVDINGQAITVTDYKTGKPSTSWTGKSDYEKIKLHKYRQQLMFYELLCANSRDYARYKFAGARLQFVEPDQATGDIVALDDRFSNDELADFQRLIAAVWRCITSLELPDTSHYEANYRGVLQFEEDLLAGKYPTYEQPKTGDE